MLHLYSRVVAASTLLLIVAGAMVTSTGSGLAVPDWPTTYGYNMFFFPFSKWVGGIFYEHSHRLVASGVGLLTVILAVWLWMKEERRWLRWLGVIALGAVIFQGVLGGLRVTQMKDVLGVFHAALAQLFFALISAIALFTSRWWLRGEAQKMSIYAASGLRYLFALVTGLILFQLILGAAMRHQHAGLAIPDFPTAYGRWWPAMDVESVARYNQARGEVTATNPITAFQIGMQMTHRIAAFLILISVAWLAGVARRRLGGQSVLAKLSLAWLALILAQAVLGVATIWTNKAADVATLHVAVGALSLVIGVMLALIAAKHARANAPEVSAVLPSTFDLPQAPAKATA